MAALRKRHARGRSQECWLQPDSRLSPHLVTVTRITPLRTAPTNLGAGETFVIVGAGQAGVQAAITLREGGFLGRLIVIGDEPHLPYMRPPLSKKFLAAQQSEERLYFRPASYFESHAIELRPGVQVEGIDRATGTLRLRKGATLEYDKLLLATGSRPRKLLVPGASDPRIHYLRTLNDALRLRSALRPGSRLAVIGAGYIGLEVAAAAVQGGLQVTVLEKDDRVLGRVTSPTVSAFMAGVHRSRGVDLRCGLMVTAFSGRDGLLLDSGQGTSLEVDAAIVGVGALPNDELAKEAGLACEDGISVDSHGRTSDSRIFAAGDCTRHENSLFARRLRLESVQNAIDQATVAATCMAGGELSYCRVPWFWSSQYEYKLQSAGLLEGHDEVIERGERHDGRFALVYLKAGLVVAVDAVNMPSEYVAARRAIGSRGELGLQAEPMPPSRSRSSTDASATPRFATSR
jgi:3-phenylpropionate/trans-cinnamate dioxygenase ferredoxin reductase component